MRNDVRIPAGPFKLSGILTVPESATAIVLFVHGSGSRHGPGNQFVARALNPTRLFLPLRKLFEEPGALENVTQIAGDWFAQYMTEKGTQGSPMLVEIA